MRTSLNRLVPAGLAAAALLSGAVLLSGPALAAPVAATRAAVVNTHAPANAHAAAAISAKDRRLNRLYSKTRFSPETGVQLNRGSKFGQEYVHWAGSKLPCKGSYTKNSCPDHATFRLEFATAKRTSIKAKVLSSNAAPFKKGQTVRFTGDPSRARIVLVTDDSDPAPLCTTMANKACKGPGQSAAASISAWHHVATTTYVGGTK